LHRRRGHAASRQERPQDGAPFDGTAIIVGAPACTHVDEQAEVDDRVCQRGMQVLGPVHFTVANTVGHPLEGERNVRDTRQPRHRCAAPQGTRCRHERSWLERLVARSQLLKGIEVLAGFGVKESKEFG
jgi:hypothetical protein